MKKLLSGIFLLQISALFIFSSCSNSNNSGNTVPHPANGDWKVSYFFDKQDETSNYSSYTFNFASGGTLTAVGNGQTVTGTWSNNCDDSGDKFCISFGSNASSALQELSEDWRVIEMKDNFMHFEHTSGGNGDTDVLKFEK